MPEWAIDHGDVRIMQGDALTRLAELPESSVQCIVTSPPFFGLRDYGVDGQIGLEGSPGEWVAALVAVFRECRRVLREDGVFWLEVGDTYAANRSYQVPDSKHRDVGNGAPSKVPTGYKVKDLIGAPWLLAFALIEDGWWLRSEVIWHKPNAMPESVTDRPSRGHSTVFMLTKSPRYFFDADAVRTPHKMDGRKVTKVVGGDGSAQHRDGERWPGAGANIRSVWSIVLENTEFEHHATMAMQLAEQCIKAGTSEHGACVECGAPWKRIVKTPGESEAERRARSSRSRTGPGNQHLQRGGREMTPHGGKPREQIGWEPTCRCYLPDGPLWGAMSDDEFRRPCVVLDPFMGSGTTALVARNLGRHSVGVELSPEYMGYASERLKQLSLLT